MITTKDDTLRDTNFMSKSKPMFKKKNKKKSETRARKTRHIHTLHINQHLSPQWTSSGRGDSRDAQHL